MKKLIFGLALIASLIFANDAFAYTVVEGDTMSEIAAEQGMTLNELAEANPQVENLDLIIVGQHINTDTPKNTPELIKGVTISKTESITMKNTNTESSKFTDEEIDLLARIVRAEAQTEPFEGKVAVAAVVLNRLESPQFPDTIREVIYQRKQFQPVANGQVNKPADEESIKAVYAALTDMRNIAEDSLFFYNPDIATSRWLDSRETTVVIGQHVFKN
ncbi:cell wall hydrolase [Ferdinandcohnia quinoae]|uniref:Cell wall hydrolase n=1 Tax=Fredinandcohnia quinoae TaxID=2918902 RepID=A0AAW5EA08_9BACI|nr:cell wall hydrolase [Fredinandcohnia sp. SECRCQ15]MCH1626722.1 cell wall hydrolase [Fredinandcohnia sp. SECRCQ15]